MGKNIHLANVKILIWKVVDDGSSRSEVGMQIAISHEVCAVSRSCFFYHGKSWNGKRYPFFKSEVLTSDMETSCWWQQQGWCRNANCCFSWSVSSKQKLFLLLWQKLKWEKIHFANGEKIDIWYGNFLPLELPLFAYEYFLPFRFLPW